MKIYDSMTHICNCPSCGAHLHYRPSYQNIYSGGPWKCGCCGHDVTEAIYGKDYKKKKKESA